MFKLLKCLIVSWFSLFPPSLPLSFISAVFCRHKDWVPKQCESFILGGGKKEISRHSQIIYHLHIRQPLLFFSSSFFFLKKILLLFPKQEPNQKIKHYIHLEMRKRKRFYRNLLEHSSKLKYDFLYLPKHNSAAQYPINSLSVHWDVLECTFGPS